MIGLGVVPNGKRAELLVLIQFAFKDDLIASVRFFFDLAELCGQSGVSTDAVRRKLRSLSLIGKRPDATPTESR
jgi:hypothetical protein